MDPSLLSLKNDYIKAQGASSKSYAQLEADFYSNIINGHYVGINRASTTASSTTATGSSAIVDRASLTITFTVEAVPWVVEYHEPFIYTATAAGLPVSYIRDGSSVNKAKTLGILSATINSSFYYGTVGDVVERITVPGTYTRKASFQYLYAPAGGALVYGVNADEYVAYIQAKPER